MFVNKFTEIIESSGLHGIQLFSDILDIFIFLFADDIALIANTKSGLQKQLSLLSPFYREYKISVHIGKTKIVVFRKSGRIRSTERWIYNGDNIEVINCFQYVGLLFTSKMSLYSMAEDLASKAKRVLVTLLNSLCEYGTMPKTVFFKLFDVKISPILLNGWEVWGVKHLECIERVQYYLCKRYMNVGIQTSNLWVVGDCGRYPMFIETRQKVVKYWLKLLKLSDEKYVKKCYNMLHHFDVLEHSNWITNIKHFPPGIRPPTGSYQVLKTVCGW